MDPSIRDKNFTFRETMWLLKKACELTDDLNEVWPCQFEKKETGVVSAIAKVSMQLATEEAMKAKFEHGENIDLGLTGIIGRLFVSQSALSLNERTNLVFIVVDFQDQWSRHHVAWNEMKFPFCLGFESEEHFLQFVNNNCTKKESKRFQSIPEFEEALKKSGSPDVYIHAVKPKEGALREAIKEKVD